MKRWLFLIPLIALVLSSCMNIEPSYENDEPDDSSYIVNYLIVTITEPLSISGRAEELDFEDGLPTENYINSIRFFFFDEKGNLVNVTNDSNNFLDWTPTPEYNSSETQDYFSESNDPNIEKRLTAQLELQISENDDFPECVVAVINPSNLDYDGISNLEDLNRLTNNYSITDNKSLFVMSNSVYADNSGKLYETVEVKSHIFPTSEEAALSPVTIYVERVNAKIRLKLADSLKTGTITLDDGTVLYDSKVENTLQDNVENADNKIYIKLLGWNVTSDPSKSLLMKKISPDWNNETLGWGENVFNWTNSAYKRSFWAINPDLKFENDYNFGDFETAKAIKGFGNDELINYTYTQENAAETKDNPTAHPSQVIVAAQLVDSQGNPCELLEWGNKLYSPDDLLTNMADFANVFEIIVSETTQKGEDGKMETVKTTEYHKLGKSAFKFVSAEDAGKNTQNGGRYLSYFQLDEDAVKDKSLTLEVKGEPMDLKDINEKLANDLPGAKIWTNGYTYYFVNIDHLRIFNDDGISYTSIYGIVRNHIYEAVVTSISGLGTPVFNEKDVIIPEKTKDDNSFIAVQINIIHWRRVSKIIQLEW